MKQFYISVLFLLSLSFFTSCVPDKTEPASSTSQILTGETIPEGYKICVLGDAGSGESGQAKVAVFLSKEQCSQVIYVGDVIYEKGLKSADDKQFMSKFYNPYKSMLENGIPFHMIMGNHDYDGKPSAWLTLAERYAGKIIFPYYYYAEVRGDVCFLGVDTNIATSSAQATWISETMLKLKQMGCELSFAYAHHPYVSSGDYGQAEPDEKEFLEENILGKVDAYMTGHDHILSDEMTYLDTRLLVSGGGGQDLYDISHPRPGAFAKSVPGYTTLTFSRITGKIVARYDLVQILNGTRSIIHTGLIEGQGIR